MRTLSTRLHNLSHINFTRQRLRSTQVRGTQNGESQHVSTLQPTQHHEGPSTYTYTFQTKTYRTILYNLTTQYHPQTNVQNYFPTTAHGLQHSTQTFTITLRYMQDAHGHSTTIWQLPPSFQAHPTTCQLLYALQT